MIANLISKSDGYHCSNCMMRQSGIPPHCYFCEYEFSNWEEIVFNKEKEKQIEELNSYESNILGRN